MRMMVNDLASVSGQPTERLRAMAPRQGCVPWRIPGRVTKSLLFAGFTLLSAIPAMAQTNESSSGSGIAIGGGDILTNWHVVKGCGRLIARVPPDVEQVAVLVARDERNDLAVIRVSNSLRAAAAFRHGTSVRAGETVLASGYPLSGVLTSAASVSTGIVNALAGLADDSRFLQISAPVQPGNSGGPLVDQAGQLIGIVTSKLNAVAVAQFTGDIPQNVNFAIKAEIARTFLESQGLKYTAAAIPDSLLSLPDLADLAKSFTAYIACRTDSLSAAAKSEERVVALPKTAIQPASSTRVALYEESPTNASGERFTGTAVWRTEIMSSGAGRPTEVLVRADIQIPGRKMAMKWSLQRNNDKSLPASHTIVVVFTLSQDFPHGGVQSVPGVLMKESEQTRGVPLSGSSVKVMEGYFLIGLSTGDREVQRNVGLLKDDRWLDVPIVYNDGRRAILAVEKGVPGERAFKDAFAAWKQ